VTITDRSPLRPQWLFVDDGFGARSLPAFQPEAEIRSVRADELAGELASGRSRLIVVAQPPADPGEVDLVVLARRRPRTALRTVLLTAPDDIDGRLAALERGFDDALPISIDGRELVARLRRLESAVRPPVSRNTIQIGDDVELDLQACELRTRGEPRRLRPKEFALLALLATHPRRAYTRRELIERVWGTGFAGDPRTIDVHLRWLRSKVERDPEHPEHLVTVRGHGYRFDPPEAR
jgi:DNA-binding response OmpR family regulator